jgi:hypothetical protein
MVCLIFVIIGSASSSGMDPCTALCQRDGPAICTGGSWNKNGICHAYLFRGDPARGDYFYHTGLTAATCPSSGTPVRIADAVRLLGGSAPSQDIVVPGPTTTTTTTIARTSKRPKQALVPPRPTGFDTASLEERRTRLISELRVDRRGTEFRVSRPTAFRDSVERLNFDNHGTGDWFYSRNLSGRNWQRTGLHERVLLRAKPANNETRNWIICSEFRSSLLCAA